MIAAKWGGSLLTDKARAGPPRYRAAAARRLAAELRRGLGGRAGLLVHGAGSFGHPTVLRHAVGRRRLAGARLERALSEVRGRVGDLQWRVVAALREAGLPAVAVPAFALARARGGRVELVTRPLARLVGQGLLPVTGGDVIDDDRLGVRVLSGDEILARAGPALGAERAVYATDVDGVFLRGSLLLELPPGAAGAAARRLAPGADATGGMRGKLAAAARLQARGVEVWIVNGARPGRFRSAVAGGPCVGTRLPARKRRI